MPSANDTADCTWGRQDVCDNYIKVSDIDFHVYCNKYGSFQLLGDLHGKTVLDLPSGPGKYARLMLEAGAKQVTSVDIDPNFIVAAKAAVHDTVGVDDPFSKWNGITADACISTIYPGGPFDILSANFLIENFASTEDMKACARNLFKNLKPGGSYVGIWAPGAHAPENRRIVMETVKMLTSDNTNMKLGDRTSVRYTSLGDEKTYHWYLMTEEQFHDILAEAGFVDIRFERLLVDPDYRGNQDLHRFVNHVGNRHVLATKPLDA